VNRVEVRQVKVGESGAPVDPGGMDDHVEVSEAVTDGVEKVRYRLLVGDVRRECRAEPAPLLDLADRRVGQIDVAGIGHGDVEPVGCQLGGDDSPHASGPAGHQRSPC
jgi:hypothetical protein